MSSDVVISLRDVSKCYHIYANPHERLLQSLWRGKRQYYKEFWALRNVSFEMRRGETLGILGRNGAGKSTLLQIITGTLAPTSGSVSVHGRVAALLELGSGFNPEFTGRENVYMNAAILGLNERETEEKFEDIAAFADIGDFIEQPIKTYSTGMMVRLAFAVQTAITSSVLIIDEALAVGDIFFQAKCIARIRRLIDQGISLLFVSHDTNAVRQLCSRALLVQEGEVVAFGDTGDVTDRYLKVMIEARNRMAAKTLAPPAAGIPDAAAPGAAGVGVASPGGEAAEQGLCAPGHRIWEGRALFREKAAFNRSGNGTATILNVQLLRMGELSDHFGFDEFAVLRQVVYFRKDLENVNVCYKIRTREGSDIVWADTRLQREIGRFYRGGNLYVFEWRFRVRLQHGSYCVTSALAHPETATGGGWTFIDVVPIAYDFRVAPYGGGMLGGYTVWDNELTVSDGVACGEPQVGDVVGAPQPERRSEGAGL